MTTPINELRAVARAEPEATAHLLLILAILLELREGVPGLADDLIDLLYDRAGVRAA